MDLGVSRTGGGVGLFTDSVGAGWGTLGSSPFSMGEESLSPSLPASARP